MGKAKQELAAGSSPASVMHMLSNYSVTTADAHVDSWVAFFPELFVRHRDYLIVTPRHSPVYSKDLPPPPVAKQVGYDDSWYQMVASSSTGNRFVIPNASCEAAARHGERKRRLLERI